MKTWILHIWNRLRTSFWFVPGVMVLLGLALAQGAVRLDQGGFGQAVAEGLGLRAGSAEGARSLMSTSATAVLTLAGLTFSATLVALTLASSQFGSRILRNFIRSLPNQFALGMLLANFVICLVVLRSVRNPEEGLFVPHLATFVAFVVTLTSLATFIYFIHHISVSLQADRIVASIHAELDDALERSFPDLRPADPQERKAGGEKAEWEEISGEHAVTARRSGYVQAIDVEGLVATAAAGDIRCRALLRPGQFVHAGAPLLAIDESSSKMKDEDLDELRGCVLIGRMRTAEQDFEFGLRQLVEIALRALSAGINDPFTAMNCVDYLGAALGKVAQRRLPQRTFADDEGTPRVRLQPTSFRDLLDAAFHQLRQTSADRPDLAIRLLDALGEIAAKAMIESHREAIADHAEAVVDSCATQVECDREAVRQAHERVLEKLAREEDEA